MIWTNFTLLKEIGEREGKFYAINVPLKDGIDDPSFTRLFKTVSSILMFFWPNCNLNKLLILIFNALFLVWWRLVWTFWNSYAIDYFQSSWNISTWCDSSPVWSRFTCWRSLGLLQSLYWWCLFSSNFLFWWKYHYSVMTHCSSQVLVPILQVMLNVLDS